MIKYFIIVVLLMFIIYTLSDNIESFLTLEKKCNEVDGRCYKISTKYDPKTHILASEYLAYLNNFCIIFMRHLRNKFLWERKGSRDQQNVVSYLLQNYDPDAIIENSPRDIHNTSYVEDKGKVFALCLREKETGQNLFINKHDLEFVVLHEITHLGTYSIGHTVEFWTNFKFLLKEAKSINLHIPVDYSKNPMVYCGLEVNYNPYYDDKLDDI